MNDVCVDGREGAGHVLRLNVNKVNLNLGDGEVGQLHEGVLELPAAAGSVDLAGINSDRASGEGSTEHVGELEREEGGVVGDSNLHHLVVSSGVLRAGRGGVVAERADAQGAIVARVAAVAVAALGAVLVPELVVGAVHRVVVGVDLAVGEAAPVAGAAVGAGGAAAAAALVALEATAQAGRVIARAAPRALGVRVASRGLRVERLERLREQEVAVPVALEEASRSGCDDIIRHAVVRERRHGCGGPRGAEGAGAQRAVAARPVLLALAHVGGAAGSVAVAAAGASCLHDSCAEGEGGKDLQLHSQKYRARRNKKRNVPEKKKKSCAAAKTHKKERVSNARVFQFASHKRTPSPTAALHRSTAAPLHCCTAAQRDACATRTASNVRPVRLRSDCATLALSPRHDTQRETNRKKGGGE